jgi:hypothetical protein
MEEAVRLWPQSRYAHAGLAHALLVSPLLDRAGKKRAANELQIAAKMAARQGKIRYVTELAPLLADLRDKTALDEYFSRILRVALKDDKYTIYLHYALALATLNDDRAEIFFRKAIQVSPKGVGEAYEFYSHYLLEHQKAQAVLDLLSPHSKAQQLVPKSVFHSIRCRALEQLGRASEATTECPQERSLVTPAESIASAARSPLFPISDLADESTASRLLVPAAPVQPSFDCRTDAGCYIHPDDPFFCYFTITWNLAELITNEAGGEAYGSRAAVGWTVRDRVNRVSTPDCGGFPGATGVCTSLCTTTADPQICNLQKKYCCVTHSGSFVATHAPVSIENLLLAADLIDGFIPEPTSGFAPANGGVCTTNTCSNSLQCSSPTSTDRFSYASEGPIFFYANSATSFTCRELQLGIPMACNVVAKETCGNSTDGVGSDNCYGRATRNRTWKAIPDLIGSSGVTPFGTTALRVPPGEYVYRNDAFKSPGGKEFEVKHGVQSGPGPSAKLRVQLKNSSFAVVYDFGTKTIFATGSSISRFRSTGIVTPAASQVIIINEGPAVAVINQITARD